MVEGTGVVREHIDIYNKEGKKIGNTTSGTFSPILKKGIGMAYVHKDYRKVMNLSFLVLFRMEQS